MILVVGLGNPGTQYENTHHNAGFLALDALAESSNWKSEHKALTQKIRVGNHEVLLAKPQTYMNLSGNSVQALMTWYKIKPSELVVFSDDVNLDLGRIRIRGKGSHGGQNGLRNIIEKIGDQFTRVRLGVGKCPEHYDLSNWVLAKFSREDKKVFEETLEKIPSLLKCYLDFGIERCMERYNGG